MNNRVPAPLPSVKPRVQSAWPPDEVGIHLGQLYTLLIDGQELEDLDAWPEAWVKPEIPQALIDLAAKRRNREPFRKRTRTGRSGR